MTTNKAPQNTAVDPGRWIDDHGDYLFRYALMRLRNREAAEDVVQEALLAAVQSHHQYKHRSSERTWLIGILKHKIIDQLRSRNRYAALDLLETENGFESLCFESQGKMAGSWRVDYAPALWNVPSQNVVEQKEFFQTLERCLSAIPARMATAFILKEIDGLSCDEICESLNLTKSNLCVLLHRARLQLRHSLEREWFNIQPQTDKSRQTVASYPKSSRVSAVLNLFSN